MQQIPRDSETRACFISEEGNVWISEDYDSQESQILASVTNDAALLELYTTGCRDMHNLVAYMSYKKQIPRDTNIADIKTLYPDLRQSAKGIEFAIGYAGNADTIAQNSNIPKAEAEEIYNSYMEGFPGVKKYQDYCKKEVLNKGYILMNPITGHRAHLEDWDNKWKKIKDFCSQPGYWQEYQMMKKYDPYSKEVYWIGQWNRIKADFQKASVNYRIQNRGAMATKLSGILFFKWIIKNNLQNKVKICLQVHDEWNIEAPRDIAEEVAKVLQQCMEKGAHPFCPRLPLSSGLSRLDDGTLPTYWIH